MATGILIGGAQQQVSLNLKYANRHGLIAGATGTGKTVTIQILAEGFSAAGVPVFLADVKGDLSGMSVPGTPHPKIEERVSSIGIEDFALRGCPVTFWDLFGTRGIPVRATISEMGPQLLARLMDLNETQESILTLAFEFADDEGLLMLDMEDLQTVLSYLSANTKGLSAEYGTISKASINAILRRLLMIERDGGDTYFGEPALQLEDLMRCDERGEGVVNILNAQTLIQHPRSYTSFLLWLLAELFENLPEVGDQDKPKMVFFFDEAHLLFKGVPKVFLEKIEQVVRLIRSKGVGIYFVSQSPADIPDSVLSQLGNRVQHALRAYTPRERKAVRVAAQSFRPNPDLDTEQVISELGVGEALVSVLQEKGVPSVVQRTLIRPPASRMGALEKSKQQTIISSDALYEKYRQPVDRVSAHEKLQERAAQRVADQERAEQHREQQHQTARRQRSNAPRRRSSRQSAGEAFMKSVVRSLGSGLGRRIARGLLGSLLGGR